jgi:hypothetical protein
VPSFSVSLFLSQQRWLASHTPRARQTEHSEWAQRAVVIAQKRGIALQTTTRARRPSI